MKLPQIDESIEVYEEAFNNFRTQNEIPREFFSNPDHFAIKCADEEDYLETCAELGGAISGSVWELEHEGRNLGSGFLNRRIRVAGYVFGMVEIMQPRPGKETKHGYVEHLEFTYPDLSFVLEMLSGTDIEGVETQSNPGHAWANIPISDDGLLEVKINDKALEIVVEIEKNEGLLKERKV